MKSESRYTLGFWTITLLLVVVKVLFTLRPEVNLFTEEAQYWLWSQNMAWHYYSKPPLVAVLNYLSTAILGNTELGVRINAILSGVGISWVTFLFGSYLYDKRAGFWAAMVMNAMPVWWLASTFHMTDSSLTFFWALGTYLAFRAIREGKKSWWIWAGIATAFGLMAKVVMGLLLPVVFLYLLFTRSLKANLGNFALFVGVSLLGFVPALIWNFQNNFDTFKHLATLGGAGGGESKSLDLGSSLKWFLEYFSGQLAIISAFLLPAWVACFRELIKTKDKPSIYLVLPGLLTFLAFAALSFMKRVEVNWPVFAYTGFAVVLGAWIVRQSAAWRKYASVAIVLSIVIPAIFILPDVTGLKSIPALEKGEQKAFNRLSGHEALAERLDFLQDSLELNGEFYFSDSYHTASELSFYLDGHPQSYVMNMGSRKNQWDLWEDMSQFLDKGNVGVFVSMNHETMDGRAAFDELIHEETFVPYFGEYPIRKVKIQIWRNLRSYQPFIPDSY
ncbi:glycosyltransferase family 39 protein [Algoriphagus sp. H41]|uniref:Glycosyltransferase family 39 protein n=1 Tax=Algoriphagus oliviformis TaxID=2811231 RepID=A0ABS3BWZ2_9BACT|nr:glycosyltransferase family 39 protein [Algoriphagus oliviformis]MBN7809382.1 glycosyltransferase family 39 protein [Algoriphagus oliviformis]